MFEDINGVIISRNSKDSKQYNDQKETKRQMTKTVLQNTTQKSQ